MWWTPLVPVDAPADSGSLAKQLVPSKVSGGPDLYLIVRRHPMDENRNHGQGLYFERSGGAWSLDTAFNLPWTGTWGSGRHNTDHRFGVDNSDAAYVVWEAHNYAGHTGSWIGYKDQRASLWNDTTDPLFLRGGGGPRMCVGPDSLYVSNGSVFQSRVLSTTVAPDAGWSYETLVPSIGNGGGGTGSIVLDSHSNVHFFGAWVDTSASDSPDVPDTTKIVHAVGTAPAESAATWTLAVDFLDWWTEEPGPDPAEMETALTEFVTAGPSTTELIHFAWARPDIISGEREIAFATLDLTGVSNGQGTWYPAPDSTGLYTGPILSVEDDGWESNLPAVASDANGVHVLWSQKRVSESGASAHQIQHRFSNELTPTSLSEWSAISDVVPEDNPSESTRSMRPTAVMLDGDLMVAFTRETGPWNLDSDTRETWFREGHVLGDTATADTTLAGAVFLDRDFVIPSGVTVTFAPGTIVSVAPDDLGGGGTDEGLPEIIVADGGRLLAAGTPSQPIVICSTVPDSSFVPGTDDWYGIRLLTMASAQNGYGFLACKGGQGDLATACADTLQSVFENVTISGATKGLSLEGNLAPQLDTVTFDIPSEVDIYMARDVIIPADREWSLVAPTHVVAANTPSGDHSYGTTGKTDLLVEGLLNTYSGNPGTDWVTFGPDTAHASTATDWGGAYLNWSRSGDAIQNAEFSYAETPLYVDWPGWDGTTTIRNCWIHHFADIGLWVHGTLDSLGAVADSNLVERGSTLDETLGRVGVYLDQVDQLTFEHNTVRMELTGVGDPPAAEYSRAVEAAYGKTPCMSEPLGARTLSIAFNTLEGPGENTTAPTGGTSGFYGNTLCGGTNRTVEFTDNDVSGFNFSGLEFNRSSDVQVTCNAVTANARGIEFTRQLSDSGAGVRFLTNLLETSGGRKGLVRTDLVSKTKIGGISTKGFNVLRTSDLTGALTPFILENENGDANTLNATHNWWFKTDTLLVTVGQINVPALIWTELPDTTVSNDEDLPQVDVSSPNSVGGTSGCWDNAGARMAGRPLPATATAGLAPEADSQKASVVGDLPRVTRISAPYPNPTSGPATIALEVSGERVGRYHAEVFDVAGRSVAVLVDKVVDAGRYDVHWSGRVNGGGVAAPGVYFVRVTGPGFHRNSRLVVLR